MQKRAPEWQVWTNLVIVYLVWGSTYLAIRIMVETLPPLLTAGARFVIAGAIAFAFLALRRGGRILRLSRAEWAASALVGSLLVLGGNGVVTIAERKVPSALAALIIASVPLWVVLYRTVTRDRVSIATLGGALVGFGGVALLVAPGGSGSAPVFDQLLLVVAAGLWALGSFISRSLPLPSDPFVSTAAQMVTGGLAAVVAGLFHGELSMVDAGMFSASSVWAFVYLVGAGSLLAFTAYVWLLQHAPISKVATYAYVNPVVAIVLGALVLSEALNGRILLGAGIIVASVAFIVAKESVPARKRKSRVPEVPAMATAGD